MAMPIATTSRRRVWRRFIVLLSEREGVSGDVRRRDRAEAGDGDGATPGACADRRRRGPEAHVRAVLQRDSEGLACACLWDAQDIDLRHVAAVVDVARRRERGRGAAADGRATGGELARGETEARRRRDAD